MNDQLQAVAAKYSAELPSDDAIQTEVLGRLCYHQSSLMDLAGNVSAPNSPMEIALNSAIQYSLGAVMRAGKMMAIEAAAADRQTNAA